MSLRASDLPKNRFALSSRNAGWWGDHDFAVVLQWTTSSARKRLLKRIAGRESQRAATGYFGDILRHPPVALGLAAVTIPCESDDPVAILSPVPQVEADGTVNARHFLALLELAGGGIDSLHDHGTHVAVGAGNALVGMLRWVVAPSYYLDERAPGGGTDEEESLPDASALISHGEGRYDWTEHKGRFYIVDTSDGSFLDGYTGSEAEARKTVAGLNEADPEGLDEVLERFAEFEREMKGSR